MRRTCERGGGGGGRLRLGALEVLHQAGKGLGRYFFDNESYLELKHAGKIIEGNDIVKMETQDLSQDAGSQQVQSIRKHDAY